MHRIRMLRHYGVIPMMVFDGGPLPAKKGTEEDRAKWVVPPIGCPSLLNLFGFLYVLDDVKRALQKPMLWQLKEDRKTLETFIRSA